MADVMIAHASISENGTSGWDGKAKAGDQTQKEVCKRKWYNKPWDCVIRAKNPDIADKIALYAEQCAENDNIGYDQSQRNTLWTQWQNTKDFTKVGKCGCDCSSLVAVCSIAAGAHIYYGNNAPRTANMEKVYKDTDDFDIIKHSDYTTKSDYLRRGDILVKAGAHTVIVISNGSKIDAPVQNKIIPNPTLSYGCKGEEVGKLQGWLNVLGYLGENGKPLVVDCDFGKNTRYSLSEFQKANKDKNGKPLVVDGIYGKNSYGSLYNILTK